MFSFTKAVPVCSQGNCYPYYEQQSQPKQECYQDIDYKNQQPGSTKLSSILRGGSASATQLQTRNQNVQEGDIVSNGEIFEDIEDEEDEEKIDYDSIALALRMTCELNRQLMHGTNGMTCAGGHLEQVDNMDFPDASQTWFHSIQPPSSSSSTNPSSSTPSLEPLTIFHAKSPRTITSSKKNRRIRIKTGCARWGPALSLYLRQLHTSLKCPPITFALALVYLDRACSAETQRTASADGNIMACPHLTPRTVHRLVLTAMVIASKAVDGVVNTNEHTSVSNFIGSNNDKYADVLTTFGMSESALKSMEMWMMAALGEQGTWVDMERMESLWNVWQCAFTNNDDFNVNNDNVDDDGGQQEERRVGGIGLQKEIEKLNHQRLVQQMQQNQIHQQWHATHTSGAHVVHIRREQHIVHVHPQHHPYHEPQYYSNYHHHQQQQPPQPQQNYPSSSQPNQEIPEFSSSNNGNYRNTNLHDYPPSPLSQEESDSNTIGYFLHA